MSSFTRFRRPREAGIGVICLLAMAATACGGPSAGGPSGGAGAPARTGGQLVWGKSADAEVLDPALAGNARSWEILNLAYERLVSLGNDLRVVPELATSWERTSPKTYVFNLRQGVKFSNGREMTADDVAGSLKRLADPKTASFWAGQVGIRDAVAESGTRVKVTLAAPRTSFLAAMAGIPASVLPMKELEAGTFDPKKDLLGTGPFKVAAHTQGESWSFVRNSYYWHPGRPKVAKLVVRVMGEDAARVAALRNGTIDVTTFENPDSIRLLKGQASVKTEVQSTTDYYRVDVNAKSSIFRDERLRQALALSIDRQKISSVALAGVGRATAAVPVAFEGACDPAAVPFARPDTQRARELVSAAGATGKTVDIITTPTIPMSSAIAQVMQRNLQAAGLKVRITPLDIGVVIKRVFNGKTADFDLNVSWFAGYGDPAMVLTWWNPELAGYSKPWARSDPKLNTLIDKSLATDSGAARTAALRETCAQIAQGANVIPLVSKDAIIAYRADKVAADIQRVEGYAVPFRNLADFGMK